MPLHLAWIIWCLWIPGNPSLPRVEYAPRNKIVAFELKKKQPGKAFRHFTYS